MLTPLLGDMHAVPATQLELLLHSGAQNPRVLPAVSMAQYAVPEGPQSESCWQGKHTGSTVLEPVDEPPLVAFEPDEQPAAITTTKALRRTFRMASSQQRAAQSDTGTGAPPLRGVSE